MIQKTDFHINSEFRKTFDAECPGTIVKVWKIKSRWKALEILLN